MTPTTPLDTEELAAVPTSNGEVTGISLLAHLKDRRAEIAQRQVLNLQVPRWDNPQIWVRYGPVDFAAADKARQQVGSTKGDKQSDAILLANIDCLVKGCIGVYAILDDVRNGDDEPTELSLRPGDPEGSLTRFDGDLARNLGLNDQATARQVVRTLFYTDGDILGHAARLAKWSGYTSEDADEQLGES